MKTKRMVFGIVNSMVVVFFGWRLLDNLVKASALGLNSDLAISIGLKIIIIVLFMIPASKWFYGGSFLSVKYLNKWDVITVRAIYFDGKIAYVIAETISGEKISIKFASTEKAVTNFKPNYHYKYNGECLKALPIGKNS
ncbi:MAG: hypothetical protein WCG07_00335 [Candidatus Taylorbacteria bacterium]